MLTGIYADDCDKALSQSNTYVVCKHSALMVGIMERQKGNLSIKL